MQFVTPVHLAPENADTRPLLHGRPPNPTGVPPASTAPPTCTVTLRLADLPRPPLPAQPLPPTNDRPEH
eukprot:10768594-Prorocentrum_lima.AAC.1